MLTDLGRVEMASAMSRLVRMEELTEQEAMLIEGAFEDDIAEGYFVVRGLKPHHFTKARGWLASRATPLRSLDALHLASASLADSTLITGDISMSQSAEYFGLSCRLLQA